MNKIYFQDSQKILHTPEWIGREIEEGRGSACVSGGEEVVSGNIGEVVVLLKCLGDVVRVWIKIMGDRPTLWCVCFSIFEETTGWCRDNI